MPPSSRVQSAEQSAACVFFTLIPIRRVHSLVSSLPPPPPSSRPRKPRLLLLSPRGELTLALSLLLISLSPPQLGDLPFTHRRASAKTPTTTLFSPPLARHGLKCVFPRVNAPLIFAAAFIIFLFFGGGGRVSEFKGGGGC